MDNDLIYMKWSYNMKQFFLKELDKQIKDINSSWTFTGIIDALQCIDMNNRNIENYLFNKYGEKFITELLIQWVQQKENQENLQENKN